MAMNFSEALALLKENKRLYRKGWNGTMAGIEMYVYLVHDSHIIVGREKENQSEIFPDPFFIFYHSKNDTSNFWTPSMWDIMAEDWEEVS